MKTTAGHFMGVGWSSTVSELMSAVMPQLCVIIVASLVPLSSSGYQCVWLSLQFFIKMDFTTLEKYYANLLNLLLVIPFFLVVENGWG